jgi:hypothetical protein
MLRKLTTRFYRPQFQCAATANYPLVSSKDQALVSSGELHCCPVAGYIPPITIVPASTRSKSQKLTSLCRVTVISRKRADLPHDIYTQFGRVGLRRDLGFNQVKQTTDNLIAELGSDLIILLLFGHAAVRTPFDSNKFVSAC